MKNLFISFTLFTALVFVVSCGGSSSGSSETAKSCVGGAFNCKENAVFKCEDGDWQQIEECAENQKCNPMKGICETVDENGDTASDADTDEPDTTQDNLDTDDADTTSDGGDSQLENPDTTPDNSDSDDTDSALDDGDTDVIEINDEESCAEAGGTWNSGKCTKSVTCTGLPENASWNKASGIKQTWNGTEWVPTEIGSYSETTSTTECVFKCNTGYLWNDSVCEVAPTQSADCTDLPENAQWNTVSSIIQTWDGSEWIPTTIGSYSARESTTECKFRCNDSYHWENSACIFDSRTSNCTGLPANAQWNTVSSITQTWSGSEWTPSNIGNFNNTASTTECKFRCNDSYHWENSACIFDSRTSNCTGLPSNAQWNTVSSITQTWSGSEWTPSNIGSFNTSASTTECKFICNDSYHWENSACIFDSRTSNCTGLPENAQWNTVSSITQTWSGSEWTPSNIGSFNNTASTSECRYKCKTNYTWTNSVCKADSKVSNCTGLPANAQWNTVSTISQTWNGSSWQPSTTGTYNTTASTSECRYKCASDYTWNGYSCTFPECSSTNKGPCYDSTSHLMWSKKANTYYSWSDAASYCSSLSEGGYRNWRMPTISELRTLVLNCSGTATGGACGVTDSCLSSSCNNSSCNSCLSGSHSKFGETTCLWSSSTRSDSTDRAWYMCFTRANVDNNYKTYSGYSVRCVRN